LECACLVDGRAGNTIKLSQIRGKDDYVLDGEDGGKGTYNNQGWNRGDFVVNCRIDGRRFGAYNTVIVKLSNRRKCGEKTMKKEKILFVGNSYTYYNDMPDKIFTAKAEEAGRLFTVFKVLKGGYKLSQYADPENPYGILLRETVKDQYFDYVVLQDQSCNPFVDQEDFMCGVSSLKELLSEHTDHFVLYATWGRKTGSPDLEKLQIGSAEMTRKLAEAYDLAGEKFGMSVAHVGKVFAERSRQDPSVDLYDEDMTHPSLAGSMLAAETILAAIN